jgi:DNA-directed RNA polymerase specialized sigma24 family protein
LAARAKAGDLQALNELYTCLWPRIRRVIRPILTRARRVPWLEAGDVEQEAYLAFRELFDRWQTCTDSEIPFAALVSKWLPIYLNCRLRDMAHLRASGVSEVSVSHDLFFVEEYPASDASADVVASWSPAGVSWGTWLEVVSTACTRSAAEGAGDGPAEMWSRLHRLLGYLLAADEAIVVLHVYYGWSFPRVAAALGLSPGQVRARFVSALRFLRALLQGDQPGELTRCTHLYPTCTRPAPEAQRRVSAAEGERSGGWKTPRRREGTELTEVRVLLSAADAHPAKKLPSCRECLSLGLPSRLPARVRPLLKRLGITHDDCPQRPAYLAIPLEEALARLEQSRGY